PTRRSSELDHLPEDADSCVALYEEAFQHYLEQDWAGAIKTFEESEKIELFQPDRDVGITTNPSRVMIARCRLLEVDPPEKDWDGVYRMTSK
ncbi:MAG: hypothetical protein AAGC68_15310, partial [Verrucomicrobiota bacterium]